MSTGMSTDALAEELKFVEEDLARQPGELRPGDAAGEDDLAEAACTPREFEDIYDRTGQLMNFAFGLAPAALAGMPWVPLTDLSDGGLRAWAEDVIGS